MYTKNVVETAKLPDRIFCPGTFAAKLPRNFATGILPVARFRESSVLAHSRSIATSLPVSHENANCCKSTNQLLPAYRSDNSICKQSILPLKFLNCIFSLRTINSIDFNPDTVLQVAHHWSTPMFGLNDSFC
jgi:hypothetical protein